ncbi:PVC-type heme-binding CxxCH protein [Tuwongella immobilis]|uniref:Cytochrome c domain-containing protein n=1 Tax=Tuwongella immobilis TaxID=692036 RepID=A0A6C2YNL1_9BACT|nr:PVC-type heme-binding CxxCH protein [Tuwongella immobilis]VIP02645.1 heme-binding protein : Uncharacterized protein OS=Planctomyces maris DSM 8797 GN=PM8797T_19480 PE=4 SV=1: GSDH: Cytochrom_C [Tuwongella immobilis]VTS02024.1 heme-binding protein : Uncharacterized protein OS=Planctomyces maris DSM 8797 GN=PM8797T_19480 PE=4 SV=1: GSDH: Cytochrom_C [Tuwongella immobilis]
MHRRKLLGAALLLTCGALVPMLQSSPVPSPSGYNPPLAPASDEALKAIPRFQMPANLQASVWAAEPLLAQPVAFCIDEKGRIYVAETFRHSNGVTDNRSHMNWLDDELACRTVEDRVAMYRKYLGDKGVASFEKAHDRVRQVVDTNGDGVADRSTVFADGFNKAEDGIGSGLLARNGEVFYTCIPSLWKLKDTKDTGRADVKEEMSRGYGVHVAFIGHDLHGLRMGPDGKLYFTVGDRGLNVKTREGKHLFYPDTGCVLRCDPDGANLEVVASGLRNPQELAFDDYGNLFTCDNNSDSGDQARWVYVVPGGDSGWRIGYQYGSSLSNRGPWNAEKIWHTPHADQPAYVVPPLAHFGAGPSGLTHYPGIGLDSRYADHFFMCDFRGGSGGSGIWSVKVEPNGAAFKLANPQQFIWKILATDVDFGPDGGLYVSDWVEGWNLNGKGRIYRFTDPKAIQAPEVAQAKKLIADGFAHRNLSELADLLKFPHQQVRLESQYAIASKGEEGIVTLVPVMNDANAGLGRLHAIWGLGMIARNAKLKDLALEPVIARLQDPDANVAMQALKVYGEAKGKADPRVLKAIVAHLKSTNARLQFFAATALGAISQTAAPNAAGAAQLDPQLLESVLTMLRENADRDAYLRHAGVMALVGMAIDQHPDVLKQLAADSSPAVRVATVVALRKRVSPEAARFLNDVDPKVVVEAARAIHDTPISAAIPALAALTEKPKQSSFVLMRAANAHFRLGKPENAVALAQLAANADAPEDVRIEALAMLGTWAKPGRRDRITGETQSLPDRSAEVAVNALKPSLGGIFRGSNKLRGEAAKIAGNLGIKEVGPALIALVNNADLAGTARVEALQALDALKDGQLAAVAKTASESNDPQLRNAGRAIRGRSEVAAVVTELATVLDAANAPLVEKQGALDLLAKLAKPEADAILAKWTEALAAGKVADGLQLDVRDAAQLRAKSAKAIQESLAKFTANLSPSDPLAAYAISQVGGDAARGREIFLNKSEVQCLRCHKVQGNGGEVGPELTGIGGKQNRAYLLEAIVLPSKQIAKGYESVVLNLADGKTVNGILKSESPTEVQLMTAEGKLIRIPKEDIDDRQTGPSAMPADLMKHLSARELRDLVEYLATVK